MTIRKNRGRRVNQTRLCACGRPAMSSRSWYCERCFREAELLTEQRTRERDAQRPSANARGYGVLHRRLRKAWELRFAAGEIIVCAREGCGRVIDRGEPWDLGHDDVDRSHWTGPEHRACNRATAGRR
jgi:hypothetical protein